MFRAAPSLADLDDTQLMELVQADDRDAFAAFYDRFAPRVHGLAHVIGSDSHAEDIVQEAFLSMWRSRATFRPERGTVPAWVVSIVRNRALDSRRRHGRHDDRRADGEGMEERLPATVSVEHRMAERDEAARLRASLARLPDAQRDVITLAYFGELSVSEIARQLSLPLGTVKGRMRLGLIKLRRPVHEELRPQPSGR